MATTRRSIPVGGRRLLLVAMTVALAGPVAGPTRAVAAPTGSTLVVGTQTLTPCGPAGSRPRAAPPAWCGSLAVPLDPASPGGATIPVAYRFYPSTAGPALGTVMPVEGGPGYPSTGSVAPDGYAAMYGPLLEHRNMLVVDLRGTGGSDALVCRPLQQFTGPTGTAAFADLVGRCGERLDRRWRAVPGGPAQASDLFVSAIAADDVADVVTALGVGPVDLYGDSYGSWFAQVFASRHPALVRTVTLDSTYLVDGLDPWYRSSVESMPADFDAACARSPACASAAPGSAWARIGELAAELRTHPLTGTAPGPAGRPVAVTLDVVGLVNLVNDAGADTEIYRALDAAARAELDQGDPAPLLRLYAEAHLVDEGGSNWPAELSSDELYFAVSCLDYPQLFDMGAPPADRRHQLATAEARLAASTFAPFTTAEWLSVDQYTEAYRACTSWPSPTESHPPVGTPPLLAASTPVLVLGGEFDTWTPPADLPRVVADLGGTTRTVLFANEVHGVAFPDPYRCASVLLRQFVERPDLLASLDASCAAAIPALRAVGAYPGSLTGVTPAVGGPGGTGDALALRLVAAAVETAADASYREAELGLKADVGLHGGTVRYRNGGASAVLAGDQLVPGVAVSGTLEESSGTASGALTVVAGAGLGTLAVSWPLAGPAPLARVTGSVDGQPLVATLPAP
ncbi:MAG TPA: alpha/beta fold hydrolase [Acidimicrobiales bacterium]|nr:alpha/beta fold hydrolase [Acidimicrobiales bacterium]